LSRQKLKRRRRAGPRGKAAQTASIDLERIHGTDSEVRATRRLESDGDESPG